MLFRWQKSLSLSLAIVTLTAAGQAQSLLKDSPFSPTPGASAMLAPQNAPSAYEFVGMTVVANVTMLSINRVSDKRSVWVPLGKTVNLITAVNYDPRSETAVIRADNQTLTLTMRKAVIAPAGSPLPSAPMPASVAVASEPPPPPPPPNAGPPPVLTDDEKANEARMMVSDLLEIGLRQRLAYEEAQRQAKARARTAPPPDSAANKR